MKADLTKPENQQSFIVQYWGQKVLNYTYLPDDTPTVISSLNIDYSDKFLSLRHISSLTEEERIELLKILGLWHFNESPVKYSIAQEFIECLETGVVLKYRIDIFQYVNAIDYLRSISILIPWRGNSCEEIIQSGVAVYRKEKK